MYATDPGSGTCEDMLGLFTQQRILIADNTINAPRLIPGTSTWRSVDETPDEFIHGALMALDRITVENYAQGATTAEPCGAIAWGRGCLFITGGLIQTTRGPVSTSSYYGGGTGYMKRYTHDTCAFTEPPPYVPTTGHFWKSRYYEVDPTNFDATTYFQALN